jgi:hypothetical protein
MATAPALLRNGASVDHIISIFANPEQPGGIDSATSEQPCSSNSKQQHLAGLHGPRKETSSAAAAIAAANESAAKYSARSHRAPSSDSQQQGNAVLAYRVTPINLLTGSALAQPQVLSGTAAIALQTLLMKLNTQRLQEQLQQQHQVTAQQSEAMQPLHQQRQPAVKQEEGAAAQQQQQQQQPVDSSAALARALAAAGQAAAAADLQETLPHLPGDSAVAKDVLALVPQQGPSAMVEQLQEYMQLQQRLGTKQQGPGAAAERSTLELDRAGSGACSSSCSDPLQQQPERQRSGAMKLTQGLLLRPGQQAWPSAGDAAAAAAAPAKTRR